MIHLVAKRIKKDKSVKKSLDENPPADYQNGQVIPGDADLEESEVVDFPIVGIGASAGGLEAFEEFFTSLPPDCGIAFILVQHSDPTHKSLLPDILQRFTKMSVVDVENGMAIEPDHVYIGSASNYVGILHGTIYLISPDAQSGTRFFIDYLFRSLGEDLKDHAIGIILSGTGTDGTLGVRAIKGEGGMIMCQSPESAKYDGMPLSAISTNLVDFVLPVKEMAQQLLAYVKFPSILKGGVEFDVEVQRNQSTLEKMYVVIRSKTSYDFSFYKPKMLIRRIEKRMKVNKIEEIADYSRFLQANPGEVSLLVREFFIGVSSFFRDRDAFDILENSVIPSLIARQPSNGIIRIWVPGCSTGEEAYSLAMVFQNQINLLGANVKIQIFATDLDGDAIERARRGVFPESIIMDVAPENLAKYFHHIEGGFKVRETIRECIVFAPHNVITDPPFSKIDFISCRNVLIYILPEIQQRILRTFHYVLNQDGVLFLGPSENINRLEDFFSVIDRQWRIFRKTQFSNLINNPTKFSATSVMRPLHKTPFEDYQTSLKTRL
jgi:two-component system CheB/CheR fusion protein